MAQAQEVRVFGYAFAWDGDMQPNEEHNWAFVGGAAEYGRFAWSWAQPLGTTRGLPPYEQILTVKDMRSEIGEDSVRRIFLTVANLSRDIVYDYLLLVGTSDIVVFTG